MYVIRAIGIGTGIGIGTTSAQHISPLQSSSRWSVPQNNATVLPPLERWDSDLKIAVLLFGIIL